MAEKKKMDDLTKAKLLYSGELMIFAVIFLVLGILKFTNVLTSKDWMRFYIFPYLTLAGGIWFIVDLIWTLVSKKHRAKTSLIDKFIVMPASFALIGFDIYLFVVGPTNADELIYRYFTASVFTYLSLVYAFQAIYHYFRPLQTIIDAVQKAESVEEEKPAQENNEVPQEEISQENTQEENKENEPTE